MEKHTQAVSVYVHAEASAVHACLTDLTQLSRWTLGTRVHERVSGEIWVGEVSSSTQPVYFKVVPIAGGAVPMIEWQCGRQQDALHVIHRLCLLPSAFGGVHVQWVSFLKPGAAGVLALQGFDVLAHRAECLRLKAVLECASGLGRPARVDEQVLCTSLYIDAPADLLARHLGDLGQSHWWGTSWEVADLPSSHQAHCLDAYGRPFKVSVSSGDHGLHGSSLLFDTLVDGHGDDPWLPPRWQVWMAMPCAHVLGLSEASGCVLMRSAVASGEALADADSTLTLMRGECFALKRHVEALTGRAQRFADGLSYAPPSPKPATLSSQ